LVIGIVVVVTKAHPSAAFGLTSHAHIGETERRGIVVKARNKEREIERERVGGKDGRDVMRRQRTKGHATRAYDKLRRRVKRWNMQQKQNCVSRGRRSATATTQQVQDVFWYFDTVGPTRRACARECL